MTRSVTRRNVIVWTLKLPDDRIFSSHYCVIWRKLVLIANGRLWIIDEIMLVLLQPLSVAYQRQMWTRLAAAAVSTDSDTALCIESLAHLSIIQNYPIESCSTVFALVFDHKKLFMTSIPIAPIIFQGSIGSFLHTPNISADKKLSLAGLAWAVASVIHRIHFRFVVFSSRFAFKLTFSLLFSPFNPLYDRFGFRWAFWFSFSDSPITFAQSRIEFKIRDNNSRNQYFTFLADKNKIFLCLGFHWLIAGNWTAFC